MDQNARNNRSKQLNPNNPAYWRSRGSQNNDRVIIVQDNNRENRPQQTQSDGGASGWSNIFAFAAGAVVAAATISSAMDAMRTASEDIKSEASVEVLEDSD